MKEISFDDIQFYDDVACEAEMLGVDPSQLATKLPRDYFGNRRFQEALEAAKGPQYWDDFDNDLETGVLI